MSFETDEKIGPYQIIEQLGHGGMATVYKAHHLALKRDVALKVLNPVLLKDPSFLARFRREARLLGSLDHPNIVPVYDFAEQDGLPYLVMKYIEGETLSMRLARETLSQTDVLEVVEATGAALTYAHSRGILHRDVKPSNILIDQQGHIYLADFGIARMVESNTESLTGDMIVGTPQYISPEQAIGGRTLSEGTDIYSFGVILFELAVGCVPYNGDTAISVLQKHVHAPLPEPHILNSAIPTNMENVLLKALAKQPQDRFVSISAMVHAFREAWLEMHEQPRSKTAYLHAVNGQKFPLGNGIVTLGRRSEKTMNFVEVDLSGLDANKAVSRNHARIEKREDGYYLSDLESTNGTALNGSWLQPYTPVLLKNGDEITVGKRGVLLIFAR